MGSEPQEFDAQHGSSADATKRFDVALSFPGEHRDFVLAVAEVLAKELPRKRIFYDEWYEVELSGSDGDLKLRSMYDNARLLAPFFSEHYSKPWCRMEWGVIRGVLLNRRDEDAVFPIHLDDTKIPGWTSVDFGILLRGRGPRQIAALIMDKLASKGSTISNPMSKSVAPSSSAVSPSSPKIYFSPQWPITDPEVFGREKELALLDEAWNDAKLNIVTLVAAGGVGKTALVNRWAIYHMTPDGWRGAERVFAWSFYSQGSAEGRYSSSDIFLAEALRWFGDEQCAGSALDPYNKGQRLAELIRETRTLLLLDGAEPLQEAPGAAAQRPGQIQDMGLKGLLKGLAFTNPGLCVISTRMEVADLKSYSGIGGTVLSVDLDDLAPESGMAYLKSMGVRGPDAELLQASKDFGNNALALTLLGHCLSKYHHGDVRRRKEIQNLFRAKEKGRHARGVMAWYAKIFEDKPEGELLSILGLFDRPAEPGAVEAVRSGKKLKGLTECLSKLSSEDWFDVLASLREARLLSRDDSENAPDSGLPRRGSTTTLRYMLLDCHPLVREYFGERLKIDCNKAWKTAHYRLYEYYKTLPVKDLPDTHGEMTPLFLAVLHGCHAGNHQEALVEVYRRRIQRDREFYSTKKLGTWGPDLSALAGFFDQPWQRPAQGLMEADQAFVLGEAAVRLRAMGRLTEAIAPCQAGLKLRIAQKDWENAAIAAGNLCEVMLTLGRCKEALVNAKEGMHYAYSSRDYFQQMGKWTTFADVQHQAGEPANATVAFKNAEAMQWANEKFCPFLYSGRGFQFCDLLLAQGKAGGAQHRARQTRQIASQHGWLVAIALDRLTLGKAIFALARNKGCVDFAEAEGELSLAVEELRTAGHQEHISRGLLARAELCRVQGNREHARGDLDAAWDIATRSSMRLVECDIHLECARVFMATVATDDKIELFNLPPDSPFRLYLGAIALNAVEDVDAPELRDARAHLAEAGRLITETGYHRRDPELLLETARLEFLEGQVGVARETLARAKARVDEMGCHGLDYDVRALELQIG